jgi:outer membrane protein assembly factor BamB
MFSFEAASGSQRFKSAMSSQWEHYLAPTIFNGKVFSNGGTYGGLYAFSTVTGGIDFFASLGQYDGWTPAVDAQNMYTYVGGSLQIIDPVTGAVRAMIADPNYSWNGYTTGGAPVIGAGGVVYAGNMRNASDNAIVAFDTVAKAVRWSRKGAFSGNPAYADGLLFAANNATGMVEVSKEADGASSWSWTKPSGEPNFVSDVLVTKNLVFVSNSTTTYAIDRTSHATAWQYKAGGKLALSANGILYIQGASTIVAINLK